jgi:type IV pilus assembly protein PilE
LAGVGIPMYNDYIKGTKESTAKNNLRAIALMEADYYSDNNSYCKDAQCNTSAKLNTNLFLKTTLDLNSDYEYSVVNHASGFEAIATPKNDTNVTKYCLTESNDLNSASNCP